MQAREIRKRYHEFLKTAEWKSYSTELIDERKCCWQCGTEENLQVHHLIYREWAKPWEYLDDEVRVLCRDCHEAVHVVADDIWVACLVFEPHQLEQMLKELRQIKESEESKRIEEKPYDYRISR